MLLPPCPSRACPRPPRSGLLMDGSNENPAINLHKEYMTSENIADLFKKYNVPHPTFDHLTGEGRRGAAGCLASSNMR